MTLIVIPVILGQGARLFPETGPDLALDLVESRGVWVWEAPDLDVALELATEASKVCDRKIEVRPFQ